MHPYIRLMHSKYETQYTLVLENDGENNHRTSMPEAKLVSPIIFFLLVVPSSHGWRFVIFRTQSHHSKIFFFSFKCKKTQLSVMTSAGGSYAKRGLPRGLVLN